MKRKNREVGQSFYHFSQKNGVRSRTRTARYESIVYDRTIFSYYNIFHHFNQKMVLEVGLEPTKPEGERFTVSCHCH